MTKNSVKKTAVPALAFTSLVVTGIVSFIVLKDFAKPFINGEKENITTAFMNCTVLKNVESEVENNDTSENANLIYPDVEYKGTLCKSHKKGEEDWYRFSLSKGGSISYTVKTVDQKNEAIYWYASLRSAESPDKQITGDFIQGRCTKLTSTSFYVSAGDYYFEIESSDKHSKDPYSFIINYDDTCEMYTGTYLSSQGLVNLNLIINNRKNYKDSEVYFNFYPHSTNPDISRGRLKMQSQPIEIIDDNLIKIKFSDKEWINKSEDYSMGNFTAVLDKSSGTIYCDEYQMCLIREDLSDVFTKSEIFEFNGHKYCYITTNMSWGDAESLCVSKGGHLVSINSLEEQDFIQDMIDSVGKDNTWLGGYLEDGEWKWTDGSDFDYSNWDTDKPDNYQGTEKYIKFPRNDFSFESWEAHKGKWDDVSQIADGISGDVPLSSFGFICEWNE